MLGYITTSLDFSTALSHAFDQLKDEKTPVVFEICFKGTLRLFQLTKDFTAFPSEKEVLVQDGMTYRVTENSEQVHPVTNKKYHIIKLYQLTD